MDAGIKFNILEYGDPLINKNWSYNTLMGTNAAKQTLEDTFKYANDIGFSIIYDTLKPEYIDGKLSIQNVGINGDLWPIYDESDNNRIDIYKEQIEKYKFQFICEIEFPEPINAINAEEYSSFLISLVKNDHFKWIKYWQISENPEIYINGKCKTSPEDYVNFIKISRNIIKRIDSSINIGGPGIYKCLSMLDNLDNPLLRKKSFYHNWLNEAIEYKLLNHLDFFSIQLIGQTNGLNYDRIEKITNKLKTILKQKQREMPIYSINQGYAELNDENLSAEKTQAYYNISEMLHNYKCGVIPIINGMINICDDLNLNPDYNYLLNGYGILDFDLTPKYQYKIFKFILKYLKDCPHITINNVLYDNDNADNLSVYNDDGDKMISIVWSKNKVNQKIVIKNNKNAYCIFQDEKYQQLINPYEWTTSTDFLIIRQKIQKSIIDYNDLHATLLKQYMYINHYRKSLIDSIPMGYNTESDEMNFLKLLRAIAIELAELQMQEDIVRDDAYLETAHDEALYNNFGTLIDLEKQADWGYEKYRRCIQAVMKSLLAGPTVASIEEAMNTFVNYDYLFYGGEKVATVKIHELYNDTTLDPMLYNNILVKQFVFVVEINRDINVDIDKDALNRDLQYLINILKPAHTLSYIISIVSSNEDYKAWYHDTHYGEDGLLIAFKDSDEVTISYEMDNNGCKKEGIYGWKHYDYEGQFFTYDPNKKHNSKISSGIYIGPRYMLADQYYMTIGPIQMEEKYDRLSIENADLIRYGYYKDEKDSLNEQQYDNPEPLLNSHGHTNPKYKDPDSGEYYQNWWIKFHSFEKDLANEIGANVATSFKYTYKKINGLDFNKDVKFEKIKYEKEKFDYVPLPLLFTINLTRLPKEKATDLTLGFKYNFQHGTAPIGMFDKKDNLPYELKINHRNMITNSDKDDIESDNIPFNDKNQKAYRTIPNVGDINFRNSDQSNVIVEHDELKFGIFPHIFKINKSILITKIPNYPTETTSPLAYGYSVKDNDISYEIFKIIDGKKVVIKSNKIY